MKSFQVIVAGVAAFMFAFAGMAAAEGILPGQDLRIKAAGADYGLEDDLILLPPFEIITDALNDPSVTFITVKNDPAKPTLTISSMTAPAFNSVVTESAPVDASSLPALVGGTNGTSTFTSYTTVTMTKCSTCVGGGTFGTPTGSPVFVTRKYRASNGTASLVMGTGLPKGTGGPIIRNVTFVPINGTNVTAPETDSSAVGGKSLASSIVICAVLLGAVFGL